MEIFVEILKSNALKSKIIHSDIFSLNLRKV